MIDLDFYGPRYTWMNWQTLSHLIQERIDRVFVNADWNVLYLEACLKHLERSHSDHSLIVLSLRLDHGIQFPWPFRFQPMWLCHPSLPGLVRDAWFGPLLPSNAIASFTDSAKTWNRYHFGNIFHRKRRVSARLREFNLPLGIILIISWLTWRSLS